MDDREYTDRALRELRDDVAVAAALARAASSEALAAALASMDRRLSELNNFRAAFTDRERDFPSREVVDAIVAQLDTRIRVLETVASNLAGRFWALGIGLTLLVTAIGVGLRFVS